METLFNQLTKEQGKDEIHQYFKMLIVAYGEKNIDDAEYKKMIKTAYYVLIKIERLDRRQIYNAFMEMMKNYKDYRRFTVSGFISAIYKILRK